MLKKIVATAASAAMFLTALTPSFASTIDINVMGNGFKSHNMVSLLDSNKTSFKQSSSTNADVLIGQEGNTGHNKSNNNTGGDSTIITGSAVNNTKVKVFGGNNSADLFPCGCQNGSVDVSITDNGAKSHNSVTVNDQSSLNVSQSSKTSAEVMIQESSNTGNNNSSNNTGGSSTVISGDAKNSASVSVSGGSNILGTF